MKRKIVIKLPLHKEKDKSKALKIVVAEEGVSSVSIGKENDRVEVIGEGVDSVCLAKSLRKKFCFADILSVAEVKPPVPVVAPCVLACAPPPYNCMYPPPPPFQLPFYDGQVYDSGFSNCSIL